LIAGLEADVQGAGVRGGNGQLSIYPATNGYAGTSFKLNRQLEFLSTARGRVGYAVTPTLLIYVTGGFAFGGANLSGAVSQSLRPGSLLSDTIRMDRFDLQTGWTIGAGGEMALGHNLSAKLEYLFYNLGQLWLDRPSLVHEDYSTRIPIVVDATGAHARYDGHILRIGLNYRLDSTIPQTSGSAATPLFASPQFVSSERPRFGDWNLTGKPYLWAINLNGTVTLRGHALGADATVIDAITRSANLPLAFMGRAEASNGPFWAYGDLAWVQLRFAGSALSVRSPLSDVSVSASVSGRLKTTLAIGEAGAGYELGRWTLVSVPASVTAIDAYAGFRYVNMTLDFDAEAIAGVTSPDFQRVGGRSVVRTGAMWWMDPVVGLRMRHSFAPGNNFEFRGDIGGFGAGSKFIWQVFGGYSADFHYEGVNFTTLVGYRALGVNFSQWNAGRENGIDSIIHGPLTGVGVKF
jgi:opacity protein-like surface antigen